MKRISRHRRILPTDRQLSLRTLVYRVFNNFLRALLVVDAQYFTFFNWTHYGTVRQRANSPMIMFCSSNVNINIIKMALLWITSILHRSDDSLFNTTNVDMVDQLLISLHECL